MDEEFIPFRKNCFPKLMKLIEECCQIILKLIQNSSLEKKNFLQQIQKASEDYILEKVLYAF